MMARERDLGPQPATQSEPWWDMQERLQAELKQRMNIRAQAGDPFVGPAGIGPSGSDLVGNGMGAFRPTDELDPDVLADIADKAKEAADATNGLADATARVADDLTGIQEKPTFEKWVDDARETATTMQGVFNEAVDGIASGIGQMVANGKADFESLGRSIIAMMVEIHAKALVLDLMSLFTGSTGSSFYAQRPGEGDQTIGNTGNDQGGHSRMQFEPPKQQQLRIPEQGSFKAPQPQVNVNISTPAGTQSDVQQTTGPDGRLNLAIMVEQIEGAIASNIGAGGGLAPALEGQYGLNRVAGATR